MSKELELQSVELEVGRTYPIYAQIVDILERNGDFITKVELGFGDLSSRKVHALVHITDPANSDKLFERSFEPGIFVSKVLSIENELTVVECTCIIFGKSQHTKEMQ
jgi:hypothetical protein